MRPARRSSNNAPYVMDVARTSRELKEGTDELEHLANDGGSEDRAVLTRSLTGENL